MHRIDAASATPENQFTEGSPTGGVPATQVTAAWLNDIQEELVTVLSAAAIEPAKGVQNQLLTALLAMFPLKSEQAATLGANGWASLLVDVAGQSVDLIFQWGAANVPGNTTVAVTFPVSFPAACLGLADADGNTTAAEISQAQVVAAPTPGGLSVRSKTAANSTYRYIAIGY